MAALAEIHVVFLIFHQHPRLFAPRAADDKSSRSSESASWSSRSSQWQPGVAQSGVPGRTSAAESAFVAEVVFRQLHLAVEDRDQVLALEFLGVRIRPVALQTKRVDVCSPQQVLIFSAVWLVAGAQPSLNAGW